MPLGYVCLTAYLALKQYISGLPGSISMRFFSSKSTFQALNILTDWSISWNWKSKLNVTTFQRFASVLRAIIKHPFCHFRTNPINKHALLHSWGVVGLLWSLKVESFFTNCVLFWVLKRFYEDGTEGVAKVCCLKTSRRCLTNTISGQEISGAVRGFLVKPWSEGPY